MLWALLLVSATSLSLIVDDLSREWQTCLFETSKLWAVKQGPADLIVDAAVIHCRDQQARYLIAEFDRMKESGLNNSQAEEMVSVLAGGLLHMNRGFANEMIVKARSNK